MKKILLSLALLCGFTSIKAQRNLSKDSVAAEVVDPIDLALAAYDFETAESMLNADITKLKRKRLPTVEKEEKLQWLRKAQTKLNAVEKVTFIDSLIVPRSEALKHIRLSPECGTLHRYGDYFGCDDKMDCTVFLSEMGDQIYYAEPDTSKHLKLFSKDLFTDNTTSEPKLAAGISDNEETQNYPFMMADGATIYFAAQGSESLGGYDIFMSRYDTEQHRFLSPENIGMPFNSPANDYLYAIDEYNNLGWFVTDRNMPDDKVCIYIFIPNETRQVYLSSEVGNDTLRHLALINCIRDTWTNEKAVRGAQFRLREVRAQKLETQKPEFDFIVTDNRVYHSATDFKSPEARELLNTWKGTRESLASLRGQLAKLREKYHRTPTMQRTGMEEEIKALEQKEETLVNQTKKIQEEIRQTEIGL